MVTFTFKVKDPQGLHPRPAGQLVKEAVQCTGKISIRKGEKSGDAKLIFHVLSLSVKAGEEVEISVEGENEQAEAEVLKAFVKTL